MEQSEYKKMADNEEGYWWHRSRRMIITAILAQYTNFKHKIRIADVGCGTGGNFLILKSYGTVIGIDNEQEALDFCHERSVYDELLIQEANSLPEKSFELITAFDVLEHLKDDRGALNNWYNALTPKGHLFLTVPAFPWLFSAHDQALHHFRRYTKSEIESKIQTAGFQIVYSSYFFFFTFPILCISRLLEKNSSQQETYKKIPSALEKIFLTASNLETWAISHNFFFPWGSSIAIIVEKK